MKSNLFIKAWGTSIVLLLAILTFSAVPSQAATAPSQIKIGTLYAASGRYAAISVPVYDGLKLWAEEMNAKGGVYVKAYHRRIPIKLIAYDDQSNTGTAATLYNQLITQDHVDILIADSGSVLTSVAVPIAREHKMLLIDQTGTGTAFFSKSNPYIILSSAPVSSIWPKPISDFITRDGIKLGIKRVAILYATNDFTGAQAHALEGFFKAAGNVKVVYDHGVPTSTSNYTVLINNIRATHPDAVIELGYPNNDIAFLRNLQDSGVKFNFLFCAYPGIEMALLEKNVGTDGLNGVYTYVASSEYNYKVKFGSNLAQYRQEWDKKYGTSKVEFGFNSVAGYTTGLVVQKALATASNLQAHAMRKAIFRFSGKLHSLDGTFALNRLGAQVGELTPLGQLIEKGGHLHLVTVYPHSVATGKAVYPAP